jgi:hypothetical protein
VLAAGKCGSGKFAYSCWKAWGTYFYAENGAGGRNLTVQVYENGFKASSWTPEQVR